MFIPNEEKHEPKVIRWINYAYLNSQEILEQYLIDQSVKMTALETVTGQKVQSELN